VRVRDVQLTHYCAGIHECPPGPLPDFALSGRSNVGKSSLVNLITRRRDLAYTSKQPGKTRVLIYFRVDERWNLVDMPGYGYAKVPQSERARWTAQARLYFQQREQLAGVIQLIDIRVGPTVDDRARVRELVELGRPLCLVMTKSDKIARSKREAAVGAHLRALEVPVPADTAVVYSSATERFGHEEILAWIGDRLAALEGRAGGPGPA
jgi:GTP-binding protein